MKNKFIFLLIAQICIDAQASSNAEQAQQVDSKTKQPSNDHKTWINLKGKGEIVLSDPKKFFSEILLPKCTEAVKQKHSQIKYGIFYKEKHHANENTDISICLYTLIKLCRNIEKIESLQSDYKGLPIEQIDKTLMEELDSFNKTYNI